MTVAFRKNRIEIAEVNASLENSIAGEMCIRDSNHRISLTQEASVLSALLLAQQGLTAEEIKNYLEERAYQASIYITVDSMEYLKKGGGVTPAAAAFASVLHLKPILTIQGDKLDTYAKARGMKQAEEKLLEAIKQDRLTRFADVPDHQLRSETAGTLENEEKAEQWRQLVQRCV